VRVYGGGDNFELHFRVFLNDFEGTEVHMITVRRYFVWSSCLAPEAVQRL